MNQLSKRAQNYISKQHRDNKNISREQVISVIENHGVKPFEAIVRFELDFGGLTIKSGLETLSFGVIWGGGFPFNAELATIDFESDYSDDAQFLFECAKTGIQIELGIDEFGRIYKNHKIIHSSFEKLIENLSIRAELKENVLDIIYLDMELKKISEIIDHYQFKLLQDATDEFSKWYVAQNVYLNISEEVIALYGNNTSNIFNSLKNCS